MINVEHLGTVCSHEIKPSTSRRCLRAGLVVIGARCVKVPRAYKQRDIDYITKPQRSFTYESVYLEDIGIKLE